MGGTRLGLISVNLTIASFVLVEQETGFGNDILRKLSDFS